MNRSHFISVPALALSALTLSACKDARPVHTSEYYSQHTREAQLRTDFCDRLGLGERDAECLNAMEGEMRAVFSAHGSVRS
jgi:hypothetical protein